MTPAKIAEKPPTATKKAGPGRPPGAKNRATKEAERRLEMVRERLSELFPNLADIDAHGLLQAVYRDPDAPLLLRVEAATRALSVEKPRLSSGTLDASVSVLRDRLAARLDAAVASAASKPAPIIEAEAQP